MSLIHISSHEKNDYHYFSTDRVVTVQIGRSTNAGKYIWTIFHPDIICAIWGDEADSLEAAKMRLHNGFRNGLKDKQSNLCYRQAATQSLIKSDA